MDAFPRKIRGMLGSARRRYLVSLGRREYSLPDRGAIVSFTFDDFPRSALDIGGRILKSYDVRGTYYAAMSLMGRTNELGEHFNNEDLERLLADGHELGSHTFSHSSCRSASLEIFEADARKGREAVVNITGSSGFHQFAYPYGHITLKAKRRVGLQMSSCRGILPGINISPVDLHMLRANPLYGATVKLEAVDQLLRLNERQKGWLIFYTHDIRENPSPFGCKPEYFENVVRLALHTRAGIMPIGSVFQAFAMNLPADTHEN